MTALVAVTAVAVTALRPKHLILSFAFLVTFISVRLYVCTASPCRSELHRHAHEPRNRSTYASLSESHELVGLQ